MSQDRVSTTRAARAAARQQVTEAEELLGEGVPPRSSAGHDARVSQFAESEGFEHFLGLYLRAIDLDADEPAYPWNLAAALNRLGRPELALGYIGRAIRVGERLGDDDWSGPDEYLVWAETAINAGQDEVALVAIAKAVEQAPSDQETSDAALRLLRELAERRVEHQGDANQTLWIPILRTHLSGSGKSTANPQETLTGLLEKASTGSS